MLTIGAFCFFSSRMAKKQFPSPDDIQHFRNAVKGTIPLNSPARVIFEPPKPSPRPRPREPDEISELIESAHSPFDVDDLSALAEMDSFARSGVSRKVLRDLRRGRWPIQNSTDLHGLTRYEAHAEVARFMAECQSAEARCVRIVHGRGYGSPGREGILRPLVKRWLIERRDVLAFCHAPFNDGGDGALWLLLSPKN